MWFHKLFAFGRIRMKDDPPKPFKRRRPLPESALPYMRAQQSPPVDGSINGPGLFECEVVGESNYQGNLIAICGDYRPNKPDEHFATAVLVPEPQNPYDKNAVMVLLSNLQVGYLDRQAAKSYMAHLRVKGLPSARLSVPAVVRGGWLDEDGKVRMYGVCLDLEVRA